MEEKASELEEEEESLELEEGKETSELGEEGEGASELEDKEEATALGKEQPSTFQSCSVVVNTKHGVEITTDELKNILAKEAEDSEKEEEERSEWELGVFLLWEEGKDFEIQKLKTTSQIEKKEDSYTLKEIACSYLASDSEKKTLVKHELTSKETDLIQETGENVRSVIGIFGEIQEEIRSIENSHP
ncbi:LINE1 type transposase domain containing 1 [Phyllostomus discolor]|uniref:LINE1 type transposase domain containing 1 n=1 Tax=Phyllostomus discolor TaxID=89673 RepID=A0A834ABN1_9CHIR|nr:LINE1 type transposase domain containing 1 [Phyllostomus discolor]